MARKRLDYPHWEFRTRREWQADVRRRLRALDKAVRQICLGSAWYPDEAYGHVKKVRESTNVLLARLNAKAWK